jgi:branched-chain amino acid transport system substrate-binding protein
MPKFISRFRFIPQVYLILGVITFFGCQKQQAGQVSNSQQNSILIGEVVTLTGPGSVYGKQSHQGALLAIQETNAMGGVGGKPVRLTSIDSHGSQEESVNAVGRLVSQEGVLSILGSVDSSHALAMASAAQQNRVPFIATIATHLKVTDLGNYVFRSCMNDSFQGVAMARFALENLKLKKVAVLVDQKSDYSLGLAESFVAILKKRGGEIVKQESYESGAHDFKAQLASIKGAQPEAIFVPGYYSEVKEIAQQARKEGIQVPFLGSDAWDSPEIKALADDSLKGSYFTSYYSPENPSPQLRTFISKYQLTYGESPDGLALMGYEGAQLLLEALKRSHALSPTGVRDALAVAREIPTVSGRITIDKGGSPSRSTVVLKIDENQIIRFQATIQPEVTK